MTIQIDDGEWKDKKTRGRNNFQSETMRVKRKLEKNTWQEMPALRTVMRHFI